MSRMLRLVAFVATAVASSIAPGASAQEETATPPLPTIQMEGFRVDAATRALTALESAKAVENKRKGYLYCYLEGASSRVTFRHDEPLAFAYRMDGSPSDVERVRRSAVQDPSKSHPFDYRLEFLSVSEDGRRYGTGKFVPMDRELYGDVVTGVNPKKPKEVGQSRLLKSRGPLAPGEYALAHGGLVWKAPYGGSAICSPFNASAFRIVVGQPLTQGAPTSSTSEFEPLRRAAEQGDVGAQGTLGHLHFLGTRGGGVLQDYVEAHKWLDIAAARSEGAARKRLVELRDSVVALMTPVERAEAQRRAVEWLEAFQRGKR